MGMIVAGFLTGIFMYVINTVLYSFTLTGGALGELFKFTLMGIATYKFVEGVDKFTA